MLALFLLAACSPQVGAPDWHQATGPFGNWNSGGVASVPHRFSVRTGENILWCSPLPETGQGGIVFAKDRVFVATMAPWDEKNALSAEEAAKYKHATENRKVVGKHIDAHCFDAKTGKKLWTRRLEGEVPAIYSYPFSDATSASPVTDGEHVWFTNAAGRLACFTIDGEPVWERTFTPSFEGPFNKQFEPFLVTHHEGARVLVHMEPFAAPGATDPTDLHGRWHYLVGLDPETGKELWRSEDALTQYNAPTLTLHPKAGWSVIHARGGPHAVPERPVGVSITGLFGEHAGKTLARYDDPRGNHEAALHSMAHDQQYVYWILKEPRNEVVLLDATTLEEKGSISLTKGVQWCEFDREAGQHVMHKSVDLEKGVFPSRYTAVSNGRYLFFQVYATAWGKPSIGPPYCIARINIETRQVCYLEVPSGVERREEGDRFLWRTPQQAKAVNSRGVEVTGDERSRWDGWDWVFNGTPTLFEGGPIYFTMASGLVYVLKPYALQWDQTALASVSDLGPAGETWSANSLSFGGGQLYHRTARELICIAFPRQR